jgi:hypothetical protein
VQLLHSPARTRAVFDDPNLLSHAGLAPLMALAGHAGLPESLASVRPAGPCGTGAVTKAMCLVAGMAAGADSIDDMGVLRHGAMGALFGGIRAPSTLGSHLRAYNFGNVAQLEKVNRRLLPRLSGAAPLLQGAERLAWVDIDSSQKIVYGYAKQGARFGVAKIASRQVKVRGLNPLAATVSTPAGGFRLRASH